MSTVKAIDFFCGAGGMTVGLKNAGIEVLAGIDNDATCRETYQYNNIGTRFISSDIAQMDPKVLKKLIGIKKNDPHMLFIGCAPCQFWSKINTDKRKSSQSKNLLIEFQRFIDYFNPGYVVIENVPGLKNNKNENIRQSFLNFLTLKGYFYKDDIINIHDYGVPQNRKRYLIIASKKNRIVKFPEKLKNGPFVVRNFIGINNGYHTIKDGHQDPTDFMHTASTLSKKNRARIAKTKKNGGTRACWKDDPDLQLKAYSGKDNCFKDVYGRMFWDKPAPTITTRFNSLSNGRFGHPDENRAISLREGATLQTFPINYVFKGTKVDIARHIGNAVPPVLAEKLGDLILSLSNE